MNGRVWTIVEIELLRRFYPHQPTRSVAMLLGRKTSAVYNKAFKLALHKSDAFLVGDKAGRIQRGRVDPRMVRTQFQPGMRPWNKGTHFVAGGRSAQTRFKKGRPANESFNYKPIGSYRLSKDGYLERKVSDDPSIYPARRWVAVHRLVWTQAHGDISPGHIVTFRPGRFTNVLENISVDGLECISRAEHARRNHPRSKSPELARLVAIKGAITRHVNRIIREHEERTAA